MWVAVREGCYDCCGCVGIIMCGGARGEGSGLLQCGLRARYRTLFV